MWRMVLSCTFTCVLVTSALAQQVILGVLEDVPGVYAGEKTTRQVRVAFRKQGNSWVSYPQCESEKCLTEITSKYPAEVHWIIAFDGRNLGAIDARTPKSYRFYSHIGLQEVVSKAVPAVGSRSAEYASYATDQAYRPLVAISQANFKDPDGWKPSATSPQELDLLRKNFMKRFPKLCRENEDETKLNPLKYEPRDITITKSYRSKSGWIIAGMRLKNAVECDNDEDGSTMYDPWFTISPDKVITPLPEGLWLVDAGDYDDDGKSELLFAIEKENRAGYMIFYDGYKKHETFEYSYH